jgi:hypothetical protein
MLVEAQGALVGQGHGRATEALDAQRVASADVLAWRGNRPSRETGALDLDRALERRELSLPLATARRTLRAGAE